MTKIAQVAAISFVVAAAGLGVISYQSAIDRRISAPVVTVPAAFKQAVAETEVPASHAPLEATETTNPEPVAYLPPPSIDLTGGRLGNQIVPGTEDIGDIYNIHYNQELQALFMAVIEPDGLRSIWRVGSDGKVERMFVTGMSESEITIDEDGQGTMYVQISKPARIYRTDDGFETTQLVLEGHGNFWALSSDGRGTTYGSLHDYNRAVLYRSEDDGMTWSPWVDFQKVFPEYATQYHEDDPRFRMRHLHGVIYSENSGAVLVGTGDVARFTLRSDDGGLTWNKVWDEGFTAAVQLGGGNRYLLCPDSLHKHPLVIYDAWKDTVQTVWNPRDHGYAGYCYSIVRSEQVYYAAFHTEANEVDAILPKSGIISSPNGVDWYPFLEWEPLSHHARTNIWLAVAENRVYASINGRLYAFRPLDQDWFKDKLKFPPPLEAVK